MLHSHAHHGSPAEPSQHTVALDSQDFTGLLAAALIMLQQMWGHVGDMVTETWYLQGPSAVHEAAYC